MEILTWNLQFCFKKDNSLWKKLARNLVEMDFDFILLQEINPYFIYDKKYKIEDGPVHYFKNGNKNIYYHELKDVLSVERPYDNFWGTVIITNEKYKIVNNHFYSENVYIGSEYFGHESLMSYDFELDNGNIITLMNFYKKGDTSKAIYDENGNWTPQGKDYDYEKNFFSDISKIANIKKDKNIHILAGDFNANFVTLEKIEEIGFEEKTKKLGSTMVKKNYHNDCIFVNRNYSNCIDRKNVEEFFFKEYIDFSDHYGIKCKITL